MGIVSALHWGQVLPPVLVKPPCLQEAFEDVMKEYPQAFNAMDLVAEHRLRVLHASWAYIHKEDPAAAEAAAKQAAVEVRAMLPGTQRLATLRSAWFCLTCRWC